MLLERKNGNEKMGIKSFLPFLSVFTVSNFIPTLLILVKLNSQSTPSTILPVLVIRKKDAGAASLLWAFFSLSLELSNVVNLVEFQSGELHLGSLVLDLFRRGVDLLLSLSAASEHWVHDFDGRFGNEAEVCEFGRFVV